VPSPANDASSEPLFPFGPPPVPELTLYDGAGPAVPHRPRDLGRAVGTAGWGVPVNAIELIRVGEEKASPAIIFVTPAATSVGRGWDSVGHRAGTYVNRMPLRSEPATPSP